MTKLADVFDTSLAKVVEGSGYVRLARGLHARSVDSSIWHGLWVTFYRKGPRLIVQPNVSVFCPAASKIRKQGLGVREYGKLGGPLITRPLYDCVRAFRAEDRMPFDYDVETIDEAETTPKLVGEDFLNVAHLFFEPLSSAQDLRDYIVSHSAAPGAGISAIALSYLLDPAIAAERIDELARISRNRMTEEFVMNFKRRIGVQA